MWSCVAASALFLANAVGAEAQAPADATAATIRSFMATGVVEELKTDGRTVVIRHEAIPNFMEAMTMPFRARDTNLLAGLRTGDQVSFRLHVTDTESWIDQVTRTGSSAAADSAPARLPATLPPATRARHPLLDFPFTNELGQAVRLRDFRGQALAITFFFTRCPIPEFCPRLSRNFEEASRKLTTGPNSPTNWHFLSVSFDTEFDTPAVLKAYGESYRYDSKHWSFLTGPADKIRELATLSDATFERDNGLFNHNFRTLIIDTTGHLQMVFPTSGDLSEAIVSEIIKAAAVTNRSS